MASKGIGGHQRAYRGKSDDWLTPPSLVEAVGPFDLDPCASKCQPWPTAAKMLTEGGLEAKWTGHVWLNPPYGPETGRWLGRLADHGDGIALVFARTETRDFHRFVWRRADAVYFLLGRLHFHWPDGERARFNAGAPSCLVAYGLKALAKLSRLGCRPTEYPGRFVRLT